VIDEFSFAVYGLLHPDEFRDAWDDMPILWTREFSTLAHMWARLTDIAEFGGTISTRYYPLGETDENKNATP